MLCNRHELAQIFPFHEDVFRRWAKQGLPVAQEPDPNALDSRARSRLFDTKQVFEWLVQRANQNRRGR
jgi:hypothetical protein